MRQSYSTILAIFILSFISVSQAYVGWNETCDQSQSATACNPNMYTTCRNSVCECDTSEMEYSSNHGYCVVLAGGSCYRSSGSTYRCVDEATCTYNADPTKRKCNCQYQRSPDQYGHCMKSYGATCVTSSECNALDLLICDFKTCRCPEPMSQIFKEKRNRCFIKVGGSCVNNPAPGTVTCDPEENECLADLLSTTGYSCQCLAGNHMEHFERQCVKGNMEICEDAAGEKLHPPCDIIGGLGCHNKRCQCSMSPDMAWDEKLTACAVLEGRGCSLQHQDAAMWWIGFGEYYYHCFTGLECVAWEGHQYEGICRKKATNHIQA